MIYNMKCAKYLYDVNIMKYDIWQEVWQIPWNTSCDMKFDTYYKSWQNEYAYANAQPTKTDLREIPIIKHTVAINANVRSE